MMTPKKFYYLLLGSIGLVLVLAGIGLYLTDEHLVTKAEIIADLKADDEVLAQKLLSAETTKRNLNELAFVQVLASEVLPDAKNQSEVILLINQIASEANISTETFSFASTQGDPSDISQTTPLEGTVGVLVLPITTSFSATYAELIDFLERTEQNKRKMQISDISISPQLNDNGQLNGVLDIQLTINAYVKG